MSERTFNWSLSLNQELEVAGQRGVRLDVAQHELRAQQERVVATRAALSADAWNAWFHTLAAKERLALAAKLEAATGAVATTVRAMAAGGLASDVDADVAEAAALRATQERLGFESVAAASIAQLALLTGRPPSLSSDGVLEPLAGAAEATEQAAARPELRALTETGAALERRVELLKRERIPNPSLSVFAQSDGFAEQVYGVGLSLPLPLPQPVGRTLRGEIEEAVALGDRNDAEATRARRDFDAELLVAAAEFDAMSKARKLYPPELLARSASRLEAIAQQVKAGRLAVRDALVAQQALVEQLKADIDVREALCLASVRLKRAAGLSLEGDSQ